LERTLVATASLVERKERTLQRIESGKLLILSGMVENAKSAWMLQFLIGITHPSTHQIA